MLSRACTALLSGMTYGLLGFCAHGHAATLTWDGATSFAFWNYVNAPPFLPVGLSNWSGTTVPHSGDSLTFAGNRGTSNYNNISALSVKDLTFAGGAGAFTLSGNAIEVSGNISNLSAQSQVLDLEIFAAAGRQMLWDGGTAGVVLQKQLHFTDTTLTLANKIEVANQSFALVVGQAGSATFGLQGGAVLRTQSGTIGSVTGSTGSVTVAGAGSLWQVSQDLNVGTVGVGTLTVDTGGTLRAVSAFIGTGTGSAGILMVTGPGALMSLVDGANLPGQLWVGGGGAGVVNLSSGATLSTRIAVMQRNGRVDITGGGSLLDANSVVLNEANARLNVLDGGKLTSVALNIQDASARAAISGSGSRAEISNVVSVAGSLLVEAGGIVDASSMDVWGMAEVQGGGSSMTVGSILVRQNGALSIRDGATVNSGSTRAGVASPGQSAIHLEGAGSVLNSSTLRLAEGSSALVQVTGGASLTAGLTYLGLAYDYRSAAVATASVAGRGSQWVNEGDLYVGWTGPATFAAAAGAKVVTAGVTLAHLEGASEGSVTVSGAGTTWTASGGLVVGEAARGSFIVGLGARTLMQDATLGALAGSEGTLTVLDRGSNWTNAALTVGGAGKGAMDVRMGANAFSASATFGMAPTGTGSGSVTGAGSVWSVSNQIVVGGAGRGVLTVSDGARVLSGGLTLANEAGAEGSLNVTGNGSTWGTSGPTVIGNAARGSFLVAAGAQAQLADVTLGALAGSEGTLSVTGIGTQWTHAKLIVGDAGKGTVEIRDGAVVQGGSAVLGASATGIGTGVLAGTGSTWTVANGLAIGQAGKGVLNVTGGAALRSANATVGAQGTLELSGQGTSWINSAGLTLSAGGLTLLDGASVRSDSMLLDRGAIAAAGATMTARQMSLSSSIVSLKEGAAAHVQDMYIDSSEINLDHAALTVDSQLGVAGLRLTGQSGSTLTTGSFVAFGRSIEVSMSGAGSSWVNRGRMDLEPDGFSASVAISSGARFFSGPTSIRDVRFDVAAVASFETQSLDLYGFASVHFLASRSASSSVYVGDRAFVELQNSTWDVAGALRADSGMLRFVRSTLTTGSAQLLFAPGAPGSLQSIELSDTNWTNGESIEIQAPPGRATPIFSAIASDVSTRSFLLRAASGASMMDSRLVATEAIEIHGSLEATRSSLRGARIVNRGTLDIREGGEVRGETALHAGSMTTVSSGGTVVFDSVELQSGARFDVSEGSAASFLGVVHLHPGVVLTGTGSKLFDGGLALGDSPGLGVDPGSVTLGVHNVYEAEIGGIFDGGGSGAGIEFDRYVVGGKLAFGGRLRIALYGGFHPAAGQRFDLFDWGSTEGQFSAIDVSDAALDAGLMWDTKGIYVDGTIAVAAVPETAAWASMLAGLLFLAAAMHFRERDR